MEVELERNLIEGRPKDFLLILAICAFGSVERHRVVTDDRSTWNQWLNTFPSEVIDEVRLVWDEGERLAATGHPSEKLRVESTSRDVRQAPLQLSPEQAFALLGRPLRVILENGRNDRAFLLAFADTSTRRILRIAEESGFLVFETAGGITEIEIRLADVDRSALDTLRCMYLCDSDAVEFGRPSSTAELVQLGLSGLEQHLGRPKGHFGTVLNRRAAENYAPPASVLTWMASEFGPDAWRLIQETTTPEGRQTLALGAGNPGSKRRRLLAALALKELPQAARAVIDMKEGRGPKEQHPRTVDAVWNGFDPFQKAALHDGFGKTFSADFYSETQQLQDETGEVTHFLARVLERL